MSHASHGLGEQNVMALVLLVTGLVYVRGWVVLGRTVPAVRSFQQLAACVLGLFVLWVALSSPLAALHHQMLSVHMVEHVLLMAVAPPLILSGAPLEPLLHAIPSGAVAPGTR